MIITNNRAEIKNLLKYKKGSTFVHSWDSPVASVSGGIGKQQLTAFGQIFPHTYTDNHSLKGLINPNMGVYIYKMTLSHC
jgi:hypothetical protein